MRLSALEIGGQRRFGRLTGDNFEPLPSNASPWQIFDPGVADNIAYEPAVKVAPDTVFEVPCPVAAVRDFITFEQHTAGSLRAVTENEGVPSVWYDEPAFYFTNPHALIGSGHDVTMPPGSERLDFELEVAAVIGRDGYNLSVEQAWDHIVGLTIFNDWSARDLQSREMQVGLGPTKGKDTATTLGPALVSLDELGSSRTGDRFDLGMEVKVNDKVIGSDSLANMAWSFAELVAYASRGTWVRQGDVIGSGTSGGGCLAEFWGWYGPDSVPSIQVGDTVTMTVEQIGSIHNTVIPSPEIHPVPSARRLKWNTPPRP